jgi:hemolysin III
MKTLLNAPVSAIPVPLPFQTTGEEIANAILHGLGALVASAGLVLLVLRAGGNLGGAGGGARAVAAYVIFAAAMIIMFLASTLYHAVQHKETKRVLRILDHSAIYLLIAGTYTPFCLIGLRGAWGWAFLSLEWVLAAAGIVFYATNRAFIKKIEVAVYIAMGWAIVVGWFPLRRALSPVCLAFLAAGGAAYTLGTFWYRKRLQRGAHVTWHAFVLVGAVCHWCSIWFMS